MSEEKQTSASKSIGVVREIGRMGHWWYDHAREVKRNGGSIAWVMFGPPPEILLSMDVIPIATEQYSSAMAARQNALASCDRADKDGFNIDICGYCRLGLGYAGLEKSLGRTPDNAAYKGLPEPDLLIGRSLCEPGYKWYQAVQHVLGRQIPHFVYENLYPVPDSGHYAGEPGTDQQYVRFYRRQLADMVAFLEEHTGRKLDLDRVRERIKASQEMRQLWYDIYLMRKAVPAPMPTEDFMSCVFPYFSMHGTDEALDFVRRLHAEVKSRVETKTGVVPVEKYRLLWIGIPPWFNLSVFNYFEKHGAVSCIEAQYPPAWPVEVDLADPLTALATRDHLAGVVAQHVLITFPPRGVDTCGVTGGAYRPVSHILKTAAEYKIDGIVMHHIRSCRNAVIGHTHGRNVIREKTGIPTLFLESDMVDNRGYDREADYRAIDDFIEALETSKRRKRE